MLLAARTSLGDCTQHPETGIWYKDTINEESGDCGDYNGDGVIDQYDIIDFFYDAAECPNGPDPTDPQDIINTIKTFLEICDDPGTQDIICLSANAALGSLFQMELGRLPTLPEIDDINTDNPCPSPFEADPPPDRGPLLDPDLCFGTLDACNIELLTPPTCDGEECEDIIFCLSIVPCDPPGPLTPGDLEVPDPPNPEPADPSLTPGEGDGPRNPLIPPSMLPPGMDSPFFPGQEHRPDEGYRPRPSRPLSNRAAGAALG